MKTEIGGYLEMEELSGQEYYPDLYKVNLGRTALMWLIESRKIKKLLLPHFLCDSVDSACLKMGIEIEYYYLNENLEPLVDEIIDPHINDNADNNVHAACSSNADNNVHLLPEGTWLYLVSYYGQLTDERIIAYKEKYGNVIVDHTHAFFQRPVKGVDTLYSCRKFFGLCDGAYLYTDAALTQGKPVDQSNERIDWVLGRYETNAGTYYKRMLENAGTYHDMEIRQMSRLTENLLRGIDYDRAIEKRNANYRVLKELLSDMDDGFSNPGVSNTGFSNPFTKVTPVGPFTFPFYCRKAAALKKALAAKKIFVPTYWSNVIKDMDENTLEYKWAAYTMPLPIDQRYGEEEMRYMAGVIKEELKDINA